jgi:hypothetical protein
MSSGADEYGIDLIRDLDPHQVYAHIRKGLKDGVYQQVRLVKYGDQGGPNSMMPWNSMNSKVDVYQRLDYVFNKIKALTGKYVVEARPFTQAKGMTDYYLVEYMGDPGSANGLKVMSNDVTQVHTEEMISLDDYRDLVEENAQLKAKVQILESEIKFTKEYIIPMQKQAALAEAGADKKEVSPWAAIGEKLAEGLGNSLPKLMDSFANHMEENKSKHRAAYRNNHGSQANGQSMGSNGASNGQDINTMDINQVIAKVSSMANGDPGKLNDFLDKLEQQRPDMYAEVEKKLGLNPE